MVDEFSGHLRILADDDPDGFQRTWESSARYMFAEAVGGRDLGEAVAALGRCYREGTQIGAMRAAAAAIAAHDLRTGDARHLVDLLGSSPYIDWVFEGIRDAFNRGLDLSPAVDLLIRWYAVREHVIRDLLLEHVERGAALVDLARAMEERSPVYLAAFVLAAQGRDIEVEPALPLLAAQVEEGGRSGRAAARGFAALADAGVDLTGVVDGLERALAAVEPEEAGDLGYCLASHHAAQRAWDRVDAVLTSGPASARAGAGGALRLQLLNRLDSEALVDRVAGGLLADDVETRAASLQALMQAQVLQVHVRPSAAVIERLIAGLDARVGEFLYAAVPAGELAGLLRGASSAAGLRLRAAVEDPIVACPTCVRLPRGRSWNDVDDMPADMLRLVGEAMLRRCPECGRFYTHTYEDEWSDGMRTETWTLSRLTPPEVLRHAPAGTYEHARALMRLRRELGHPRLAVRVEAAHDLAAELVATDDWAGLRDLASGAEGDVRARVFEVVEASRVDDPELAALARDHLADEHGEVRAKAAMIAVRHALARGATEELQQLLAGEDPRVLAAATFVLMYATREGFDPSLLLPRLGDLRGHPAADVRHRVWDVLVSLAARALPADPLPLILADLEGADTTRCQAAAQAVESLAAHREEVAAAVPSLVALLRRKEVVFQALAGLKALRDARVKIDAAVPVLVELALAQESPRRRELLGLLWDLSQRGVDVRPHHPALAGLLTADEESRRLVLQIFAETPGNVGAVAEPLRAAIETSAPYLRETAARLLARHHVQKWNVEGLRFLLRHARPEAVSMCAEVLATGRVEVGVLPDLVALVEHRKDYVRAKVADAIVRLAGRKRAAVEAALAGLPDSPALAQLRSRLAG